MKEYMTDNANDQFAFAEFARSKGFKAVTSKDLFTIYTTGKLRRSNRPFIVSVNCLAGEMAFLKYQWKKLKELKQV